MGILIRTQFEDQFRGPGSSPPTLNEIVKGRIGTLVLDGNAGKLQLTVVYGTAGANAEYHAARQEELLALSDTIPAPEEALCLAAGDWNFVMSHQDRYHVPEMEFTGIKDNSEADLFRQK